MKNTVKNLQQAQTMGADIAVSADNIRRLVYLLMGQHVKGLEDSGAVYGAIIALAENIGVKADVICGGQVIGDGCAWVVPPSFSEQEAA